MARSITCQEDKMYCGLGRTHYLLGQSPARLNNPNAAAVAKDQKTRTSVFVSLGANIFDSYRSQALYKLILLI